MMRRRIAMNVKKIWWLPLAAGFMVLNALFGLVSGLMALSFAQDFGNAIGAGELVNAASAQAKAILIISTLLTVAVGVVGLVAYFKGGKVFPTIALICGGVLVLLGLINVVSGFLNGGFNFHLLVSIADYFAYTVGAYMVLMAEKANSRYNEEYIDDFDYDADDAPASYRSAPAYRAAPAPSFSEGTTYRSAAAPAGYNAGTTYRSAAAPASYNEGTTYRSAAAAPAPASYNEGTTYRSAAAPASYNEGTTYRSAAAAPASYSSGTTYRTGGAPAQPASGSKYQGNPFSQPSNGAKADPFANLPPETPYLQDKPADMPEFLEGTVFTPRKG